MNGLHGLLMAGKVLYLASISPSSSSHVNLLLHTGHLRHARLGGLPREPVRARPRQDALQHLPGPVERHDARPRAGGDPDGPVRRHGACAVERAWGGQDPLGRTGACPPHVGREG